MSKSTINQRLKFLVDSLSTSVRAFSEAIGDSSSNTNNYIGSRQTEPKPEYLAKVINHFNNINAHWLLTGSGEPFIIDTPADQYTSVTVKKNSAIVGTHGTQYNFAMPSTFDDCKQLLALLMTENEGLRSTVAALETALDAKEEILTLLRVGHNRPN